MISEADNLALADGKWVPIPRISRVIPFGYKVSEDDPNLLIPIPLELQAIEEAKKHVKRFSYRDIANWITAVTGRSISHEGLKKRLEIERTRRTKARAIKSWSSRLETAKARAEELTEQRLGAQAPTET